MSMITSVLSLANTLIAPPEPAATIAAFAVTCPSGEFRVETKGCDWPVGQRLRYPSRDEGTTVTLTEYELAPAGIPHPLAGIGKLRVCPALTLGAPKSAGIPEEDLVSTTRHGVTGKNPDPVVPPDSDGVVT
jgi:hypothetical protein